MGVHYMQRGLHALSQTRTTRATLSGTVLACVKDGWLFNPVLTVRFIQRIGDEGGSHVARCVVDLVLGQWPTSIILCTTWARVAFEEDL